MYASITTVQVQPGKLDEVVTIWRTVAQPYVRTFPGFVRTSVFVNHSTAQVMSVVIYAKPADAEAVQMSGRFQEVVEMFTPVLIPESLTRIGYEVAWEATE
ncbi:MAG: antibiotic biosynthesis monooxygenase [Caldilineaceae bacterium]